MCNMSDVFERKMNEKIKNKLEEYDKKLADQQKEYDKKLADQQEEFAEEKRKTVLNMIERNLEDELIISCTGVTPELLAEIKAGNKG